MGRLFWKFLFVFWAVFIVTSLVVGLGVWLLHQDDVRDRPFAGQPPPGQAELLPEFRHGPPPGPPPGPLPGRPPGPWLPIAAGLLAGLVFSILLAWYVAKPIRTLRGAFREVAAGRLDTRIANVMGGRHDELADLGHDFDLMAGQIGQLVGAQRRLFHDVSHELRSPLARLQVAIGLIRQNPERLDAMLDRLERESGRLDELVGEILTLARLDSGVSDGQAVNFDIVALLEAVVDDARIEVEARGCGLVYRSCGRFELTGQPDWLGRAFENVIRNAIKYTCEDTDVEVECSQEKPGRLLITVADRGSGVPDTDLIEIFEPFYRGRASSNAVGFGLGLAIAKRAIEAHGGQVRSSNRAGGGLRVEIELPVAGTYA